MAKYRIRVQIAVNDDGSPVYRQLQADTQNSLNDRIVQAYIDSGRIWEFMSKPAPEQTKKTVTLAAYADKWMTVYKAGKLKPSTIETYKKHLGVGLQSKYFCTP